MNILLVIALLLLFVKGQTAVYNRFWNKNLNVNIGFSDRLVEEREDFQVVESVENGKKLPLPSLSVKFSTSPSLLVSGLVKDDNANTSDRFYYSDVVPAMGNRLVTRKIKCHAEKRGVYGIDSIFLSSDNLLLNSNMHEVRDNSAEIMVYPRHLNRHGFELPFNTLMGDIVTRFNLIEDPFEFRGLREYFPQDAMNRINWKASARAENYVVNQFNQTVSKSVLVAVNFSQASARFEDGLMEESLRLAVSFAEELLRRGFSLGVVSNAKSYFTDEETAVEYGNGFRHLQAIHEATASIAAEKPVDYFLQSEACRAAFDDSEFLILISFNQDDKLIECFEERLQRGLAGYWVVPTNYNVAYRLPESLKSVSGEWRVNEGQ